MEGNVTAVVTTYLATEDQALLDSEHPTECRHSNTRGRTEFMSTLSFPEQEHSYAFPTRLG